ncbi:MAG TPA: hypothetical protein VKI40_08360 [Terriglobales bacterium]|nr:hypothetical protein [Terriglobales bacterium]
MKVTRAFVTGLDTQVIMSVIACLHQPRLFSTITGSAHNVCRAEDYELEEGF